MKPDFMTIVKLKTQHPNKCRPRFSDAQKDRLLQMGLSTLRACQATVRTLHKIHGSNFVASNFSTIEVRHGKIHVNGRWITIAGKSASTNFVICGAFFRGILTAENYDRLEPLSGLQVGTENVFVEPTVEPEIEEEPTGHIEPVVEAKPTNKYEALLHRMHGLRTFCENGGHNDVISTGAIENGMRMLKQGIPERAIIHALTLNWPENARVSNNIEKYDTSTFGDSENGYHKQAPYVVALAKAKVPILLVGPTQAGKSYLAKDVAKLIGVEYGGASPLTGGASPSWLLGRDSREGFLPASLIKAYINGKVFLLDEMDAADANMLIILNNAISNGQFDHPFMGPLKKGENFTLIAAANTMGTGATAQYTGRNRLDTATLERFRMGRVEIDYDKNIEQHIMEGYRDAE